MRRFTLTLRSSGPARKAAQAAQLHVGHKCMDLADHIFLKRVPSAEPEWIAELLARLVWLTDDNGYEISNSLRRWLAEGNLSKVEIALAFREVWLWETRDQMDTILSSVEARFPALLEQCAALRTVWQQQFPEL